MVVVDVKMKIKETDQRTDGRISGGPAQLQYRVILQQLWHVIGWLATKIRFITCMREIDYINDRQLS